MGKAIAALAAGAGTVTASVGSFYLFGGNGTGGEAAPGTSFHQDQPAQGGAAPSVNTESQEEQKLDFEILSEFEKNPDKSKCVKNYFPGLESNTNVQEIGDTSLSSDTFFKSDSSAQNSCLKIEYKKTTYKDSKWSGKFIWLWTFATDSEGFISFNMAETDDQEDGKLKFTGIFYLVGKKGDDVSKWEIKHKKSISGDNKKDKLDNYFPKPHANLVGAKKSYWGFVESNDDLNNMCRGSGCSTEGKITPKTDKQEFSWVKGDDDSKPLKEWAENLTWWTGLYTDVHWSLETKIANFKGTWTLDTTNSTE